MHTSPDTSVRLYWVVFGGFSEGVMPTVLITAGPTREHLDDVRYLANGSSGRMGFAIAAAAAAQNHAVVLVTGPVDLDTPAGVERRDVVSALEMHAAAEAAFASADIVFGVAAVSDYRPSERCDGKPAKAGARMTLELVANPDIIRTLGESKGEQRIVIGFALESATQGGREGILQRGRDKLRRKSLDMVVVNETSAMGALASAVTLVYADDVAETLPHQDKDATAAVLVARAVDLWQRRQAESDNRE